MDKAVLEQEMQLRVMRLIAEKPELSQRELATELGVSLGKTNYVLRKLIECGMAKVGNFRRSNNKVGYLYLLTPQGVAEKAKITQAFLQRKEREYEQLREEILRLQEEISGHQ